MQCVSHTEMCTINKKIIFGIKGEFGWFTYKKNFPQKIFLIKKNSLNVIYFEKK